MQRWPCPEAVSIPEKKERFGAEILERKRTMASEFVVLGRAAKRRSVRKGKVSNSFPRMGKARIAYIDRTGAEALQEDGRDFFDYRKPGLWKLTSKKSEVRWKKVRGDGGNDPDTDRASNGIFALVDITLGGFKLAENGPGARQKCLTQLGKANRAAQTIKKAGAEFVFQLENLLDKDGCETCACTAARLKELVSATAQK